MTAYERLLKIKEMGIRIEVPWRVWTAFGSKQKTIEIYGEHICLGEDHKTLHETREAIEFYVNQLGGTVKWKK